jgi:hypothetical protein
MRVMTLLQHLMLEVVIYVHEDFLVLSSNWKLADHLKIH